LRKKRAAPFPNVWDIVEKFKRRCKNKGWEICEYEDLVNAGGEYHHLIWTRHVYPSTFKRVAMNPYQSVREGDSYKRVNIAYLAWISQESVSEGTLEILLKNQSLLRKIALYDISPIYKGQPTCLKVNETESPVFQEFERFLKRYRISFRPMYKEALVAH